MTSYIVRRLFATLPVMAVVALFVFYATRYGVKMLGRLGMRPLAAYAALVGLFLMALATTFIEIQPRKLMQAAFAAGKIAGAAQQREIAEAAFVRCVKPRLSC